ncbi:tRNA (Guanine(10)-N2)-methyltransferase [Pleurostoma richardsiae]|uniref:tRNA (guanine(10)-N(2))-methyltransferase n=1 Tax=Pleurostoma richardsiae TaxID=41990 RepID=A0AA38RNP6_9PEZI|nr:tRNA (Guanine(10)-N2)-methyltransferase [Pleurostoma richardsiae]
MEFLVRLTQAHESFRLPELEALAVAETIDFKLISYSSESPFCIISTSSAEAAGRLIRRSILAQNVYEHWGSGSTLEELKANVMSKSSHLWAEYSESSFKLNVESFQGTRSATARLDLINFFSFLPFNGPIKMANPDQEFTLFEEWEFNAVNLEIPDPLRYHFGRLIGKGARDLVPKFDLKKRRYISTTSMDSELALLTANLALAGPGKLFYDPFVGTGSFPIACAQFGAMSWGSDIDGRAVRGEDGKFQRKRGEKTLEGNFRQYGLLSGLGDVFAADLTNPPIRRAAISGAGETAPVRIFDGIVCDPPYGVREGLRVLGCRDPEKTPWVVEAGVARHKDPNFIPPKKPYSFLAMLDDILAFAVETLVDGGRLSFWMPTANDENQEIGIPWHPALRTVSVCTQAFNKWSRRLITYQRLPDARIDQTALLAWKTRAARGHEGVTADELNPFRKGYFTKFQAEEQPTKTKPPTAG